MGLIVQVYRSSLGDCTNNGLSKFSDELCVVNADGPFQPSAKCPAVIIERHRPGCLRVVPADNGGTVLPGWFMYGGNIAHTSDSRFGELCEKLLGFPFYGAVMIHDRQE